MRDWVGGGDHGSVWNEGEIWNDGDVKEECWGEMDEIRVRGLRMKEGKIDERCIRDDDDGCAITRI